MLPFLDTFGRVNHYFEGKPYVFVTNDDWHDPRSPQLETRRGQCADAKLSQYDSFNVDRMWEVLLNPCQLQESTIMAVVMSAEKGTADPVSMCPNSGPNGTAT